jgi:antirestriction protein
VEIIPLNEKIAQLEKDLQDRDRTEQQRAEEDSLHDGQVNAENEVMRVEKVAEGESSAVRDVELANLIKKSEKEKKEWAEKLTKLKQ